VFAVANYGHFWRRDRVSFGKPGRGNDGSLKGYFGSLRDPSVVEFKDQIGIYVLFTEAREAIYVGQAGSGVQRLLSRLRVHTRDHLRDRWIYFSWFGLKQHNKDGSLSDKQKADSKFSGTNSDALDELEAVMIQLFEPRLNKQGPKWKDTQEFKQWDDMLDPDEEEL
jgi:hypothetical protein